MVYSEFLAGKVSINTIATCTQCAGIPLSLHTCTHTHTRMHLEPAHGTKYHDGSVLDESRTNGNKLCL